MITIRKKTKMYYKEKKPTAYEFWEGEFKKQFPFVDEKESTSILLQKQISDYIASAEACAEKKEDASDGRKGG